MRAVYFLFSSIDSAPCNYKGLVRCGVKVPIPSHRWAQKCKPPRRKMKKKSTMGGIHADRDWIHLTLGSLGLHSNSFRSLLFPRAVCSSRNNIKIIIDHTQFTILQVRWKWRFSLWFYPPMLFSISFCFYEHFSCLCLLHLSHSLGVLSSIREGISWRFSPRHREIPSSTPKTLSVARNYYVLLVAVFLIVLRL